MSVASSALGRITKPFGLQPNGSFHYGTDRGWGRGSQVYPMLPGTVAEVGFLSDYGYFILLNHGRDIEGRSVESRYCHLKTGTTLVARGDTVSLGEQIATMGSTGSLTDEVHLHSELWVSGVRRDEMTFEFTMPTPTQPAESDPVMKYYHSREPNGSYTYWLFGEFRWESSTVLAKGEMWSVLYGNASGNSWGNLTYAQIDEAKAQIAANLAVLPSGGSSGGFTAADRAALADKPTKAEVAQVLTVQTGDINAHTTAAVNGLTLSAS